MKKGIIFILLTIFLVFISTRTVFAISFFGKPFGGIIFSKKAIEIQLLETTGYSCPMLGTSISILPIGSPINTPMDYYIPFLLNPKTRTIPMASQWILGKYSGKETIECVHKSGATKEVVLDKISFFGTSRF